jgi:outer membrane protein assembly factor BamB
MEESEGFGLDEFSIEMEDFEVRRTRKHDRHMRVSSGGSIDCIPLIVDGVLYFISANYNLYAVDAKTGKLLWKFKTEGILLESSPCHWEGRIYFGSYDQNLYCVDAKTGELKWKFRTQGGIDVAPCISSGRVYFGSWDQCVYCLDAESGQLVWKFRTQGEIDSNPTVHEGKLYIGSYDKNLYCLDAGTGSLVWKFVTQGEFHMKNPTLIHEGVVYAASFDNNLYAIDAGTGRMLWKFRTGMYGNPSSPIMHDGRIYHVSRDGILHVLTPEGKLLWKFVRNHPLSVPFIHKERIYVGCEDKILYCLDMQGNVLWKHETQGMIWLQPIVWDNKLYVPNWDCHLYVFDADTHEIVWKFATGGSPSYVPPAYEMFEVAIKRASDEKELEHGQEKRYDIAIDEDENTSTYKSRITYQVSTQYASKGKYQVDSDEEEF